jgi:hypothetical protein
MNPSRLVILLAGASAFLFTLLLGLFSGARSAGAQAPAATQPFQQALLVPPDDKDYIVTQIPAGSRAVVTDIVVYNVADGKSHKVAPTSESYLWVGGYAEGKSVAVINRLRTLGNDTEQWHLTTGLELKGTPDLRVSSEKLAANGATAMVYITGYLAK